MTILSSDTPPGKPHYVYTLAYPESMGGHVFYIGKGYGNRITEHEQRLRAGRKRKGDNAYKDNVILKIWRDGGEVVKKKIAFFATHEEALELEIALIFLMRPYEHLTNITDGGDGAWGYVPTEATRHLIGTIHRGVKRSEEACRRNSEGHKGQPAWNKGIARTEEQRHKDSEAQKSSPAAQVHIAKMNAAKKDVPLSAEHRRKVSEAGKERTFTEEHCRNIAASKRGRKRAPFSDEWRRNLSESHRKK